MRAMAVRLSCLAVVLGLCGVGPVLVAQDLRVLTTVRNPPIPWSSLLQVKAGYLAGYAESNDPGLGNDDGDSIDGSLLYYEEALGDTKAPFLVYASRTDAYVSIGDSEVLGSNNRGRLELAARYVPFWRDGYYISGSPEFIPEGLYEGFEYSAYLGFATEPQEGILIEAGPFYTNHSFDRNSQTASTFAIPDDYNAYGARTSLEQNTLQWDRVTGRPTSGFIITLTVEREWNDSSATIGTLGGFQSRLPEAVWRGRGHLEWYFPQSDSMVFDLQVDAQLTDEKDRVYNSQSEKPPGQFWVDGEVGARIDFADAFWVRPYGAYQYVESRTELGTTRRDDSFFGGGLQLGLELGAGLALEADYSYLENPFRRSSTFDQDTFGEHMLFIGIVGRFGNRR